MIALAYLKAEEAARFRELARSMYFSRETVDGFLEGATAGQVRAISRMIEAEQATRCRHKRERLMRKAKFPTTKGFEGYDWSKVGLPEDWRHEGLESLAFVEAAQDLVLYGGGRGKTHLAIAIGAA